MVRAALYRRVQRGAGMGPGSHSELVRVSGRTCTQAPSLLYPMVSAPELIHPVSTS